MTTSHPKRRFFRYSLRTLMIAVTVFCVWLGIATKRGRDQRLAVEVIREAGGSVSYDDHVNLDPAGGSFSRGPPGSFFDAPGPEWLRRLIGNEYFLSVQAVDLGETNADDANLVAIEQFSDLKVLSLYDTNITDAGLEHLKGLTKLFKLYLSNTLVTDEGVKRLQQALPKCRISH